MTTVTTILSRDEDTTASTTLDLGKLYDNHNKNTNTGMENSTDDLPLLNDDDDDALAVAMVTENSNE